MTDPWPSLFARYEDALRWLWSLVTDPEGKRFAVDKSHETRLREMGEQLARTEAFLAFAGRPERAFPSIHIAGTSGKGSVTAMLAHLLAGQGERVAWHTSPYLQLPLEKLIVDGRWIRPSALVGVVDELRHLHEKWEAAGGDRLRYGEAWVVLTFLWLAHERPDWGVVETGMGGRCDPTNVLPAELAVITNVSWDHVRSLGPELTDIAWHKAGIIKEGRPVVTGVTEPDLLGVVAAEAAARNAPLFVLGRDFDYESLDERTITVRGPHHDFEGLRVGPLGRFQHLNAALAVAGLDVLYASQGRPFDPERVNLAGLVCPGRMEPVQNEPLVLLDGAHNPHKMAALVESLKALYPERRRIGVVGGIVNKDAAGTMAPLAPAVDELIVTAPRVPGKPAVPPERLAREIRTAYPELPLTTAGDVGEAVTRALAAAGPDDLIIITGSLYLVGAAREYWYPTDQLLQRSEQKQLTADS